MAYIYLLGFRGLNYLKLFKIIMGGIKTFIGEGPIIMGGYQGKGDMSDGNVWGQGGGGLWSSLVLYGIIYLIYGLYTSWVLGDLII